MANRTLVVATCILSFTVSVAAEDKFFNSNGVQIRYVDEGTGEPVLLLHGFSGNVDRNWSSLGVVDNLRKDFRVIAFDSRGNGKSGKPHDPSGYGIEMAQDVVRLMDHLKIVKAHMVGYSFGATVVAKLLVTNPERFLTATLGGYGGQRAPEDPKVTDQEAAVLIDASGSLGRSNVRPGALPDDELRAMAERIKAEGGDLKALAAMVRSRPGLGIRCPDGQGARASAGDYRKPRSPSEGIGSTWSRLTVDENCGHRRHHTCWRSAQRDRPASSIYQCASNVAG